MELVCRIFAPTSRLDYVLRLIGLLIAINLLNLAVYVVMLGPGGVNYLKEITITSGVAVPFVILTLSMLQYMAVLRHQLASLAATDVLTGLANRRAFMARIEAGGAALQDGMLLMLDVDHFKRVNDTWGHAAGDACLQALGDKLRGLARQGDLVARMGGEEFALFLPGASRDHAILVGARLTQVLQVIAAILSEPVSLTVSVGAAAVRRGDAVNELIRLADTALYRAKAEGRARMIFGDQSDRAAA